MNIYLRKKKYVYNCILKYFHSQELLEVVQFTSPSEYIKKPQQDLRKSKLDSQEKEKYEM